MHSLGHHTLSLSTTGVEPIFASSWAKDPADILVRLMPSNVSPWKSEATSTHSTSPVISFWSTPEAYSVAGEIGFGWHMAWSGTQKAFLALWVNDEDFDFPDWNDPLIAIDQANVRKFAAIDPVVDLESLRGMKVKLVYDDEHGPGLCDS